MQHKDLPEFELDVGGGPGLVRLLMLGHGLRCVAVGETLEEENDIVFLLVGKVEVAQLCGVERQRILRRRPTSDLLAR